VAKRRFGWGWIAVLVFVAVAVNISTRPTSRAPSTGGVERSTTIEQPGLNAPSGATTRGVMADVLYVTATSLNVRAQPTTSSTVVATLPRGSRVRATGVDGVWLLIDLEGGRAGWIRSDYVSTSQPTSPVQSAPAVTGARFNRHEVVRAIIEESLAFYPGNCPCPYNRDRAGRSCGARSAYSKPGGRSPLYYERDVTDRMIQEYLARR
jgi:hypothetical protein